ncbi:HNH endonuclease signature motif containing protein [Paenibacillus sp. HW567]|uniref:HNH endonuclease signature motif containing protein n=1 Tax=Paenibacillus sp. HW567 TaxID=1034769 RepID=UPI0003691F4F|nr:HNH endonuclease signature motif containing protein [Paenibacillus sp. HW567]
MKEVKKLKGLLDRVLAKFKFKRFKLERKGKHIRLYGEVNPWVLLADGTIHNVDEQKLKQLERDGKKPITLSDAELAKLNKVDIDERAMISKGADGDKSRIDFDSIKGTGNGPYSNIPDSKSVGSGKKFTQTQKQKIIEENMKKNGGKLKSDLSGEELVPSQKSQTGVKPPQNEVQIDHIDPRSKGGSNSYDNAQVLSRQENRLKWDD